MALSRVTADSCILASFTTRSHPSCFKFFPAKLGRDAFGLELALISLRAPSVLSFHRALADLATFVLLFLPLPRDAEEEDGFCLDVGDAAKSSSGPDGSLSGLLPEKFISPEPSNMISSGLLCCEVGPRLTVLLWVLPLRTGRVGGSCSTVISW